MKSALLISPVFGILYTFTLWTISKSIGSVFSAPFGAECLCIEPTKAFRAPQELNSNGAVIIFPHHIMHTFVARGQKVQGMDDF
jgi:hypothetical protein